MIKAYKYLVNAAGNWVAAKANELGYTCSSLYARYGSGDGEIDEVRIDASTNSIQTIEYEHHEVHSGNSFTAHFDNSETLINERSAIGFTVPNDAKWIHLVVQALTTAPAEFRLEEAPTIDNGAGTEATIYNRNRNSGTASTVISLAGSPAAGAVTTFTEAQINGANYTPGTVIDHMLLAGGEGKKAPGGSGRGSQEWVLDQGVKYLLIIKPPNKAFKRSRWRALAHKAGQLLTWALIQRQVKQGHRPA